MGKLTGYILGLGVSLIICYYVLSSAFKPVYSWLGPLFGAPLLFVLSILYLLIGNVLVFPVLIPVLVFIGIVIGIGARKGRKAIGATLVVFTSLWSFAAASIFAIFISFIGSGSTLGSLSLGATGGIATSFPPIPKGTNIATIMAEPLVQNIVNVVEHFLNTGLSGSLSAGSTSSFLSTPYGIIGYVVLTFLPYIIINFVIVLISAGLTGRFMYKRLHRKIKEPAAAPSTQTATKNAAAVILIICICVAFVISGVNINGSQGFQPVYMNHVAPADSSFYSEAPNSTVSSYGTIFSSPVSFSASHKALSGSSNITQDQLSAGVVDSQGDSYNVYGNIGIFNGTSKDSFVQAASGSIFTGVVISDNLVCLFKELSLNSGIKQSLSLNGTYQSIVNLIPQSVLLMVFGGTINQTSSEAASEASTIMSQVSGTNEELAFSISFNFSFLSIAENGVSIYFYTFNSNQFNVETSIVNGLNTTFSDTGGNALFKGGVDSGYLVPGYTPGSVNSSIFIAGYANSPKYDSLILEHLGINSPLGESNPIVFDGGFFLSSGVFHSSSSSRNISVSSIFHYSSNITFNSREVAYSLITGVPEEHNGYNFSLYSNYNLSTGDFIGNVNYHPISYGENLDPATMEMYSNETFPAYITTAISAIETSSGIYDITTTVHNLDTSTLSGFSVNETAFLTSYGNNTVLMSGSAYSADSQNLLPNGSYSFSYSVKAVNPGTYTIGTPLIKYNMSGKAFSVYGPYSSFNSTGPDALSAINHIWYNSASEVSKFINQPAIVEQIYPGIYLFDLLPLLIVLVDIPIEIHGYRKWKREKSPKQ